MKHIRRIPSSGGYSHTFPILFGTEGVPPRVVAFDDGPSTRQLKSKSSRAVLVGVWFDGLRLHAVGIGLLTVDALDVTDTVLKLLERSPADLIFLSGASFAGFNTIDSKKLYDTLQTPTIIVSRDEPNNASVRYALKKHFPDWRTRWRFVLELGAVHKYAPLTSEEPLYFESIGLSTATAKRIIRSYCVTSRVPEPIRVAGLLARGFAPAGTELRCP